jgi:myo-inositol-1(or 4)-monophosphatase
MPTTSPGIDAATERSELVREALTLAREAHAGQTRNASGGRPYIDHPVAVAERVAEQRMEDEVLAAALLHDVVEDSELEVADLAERIDDRVAALVAALSDDEGIESYEARKGEHRGRVEEAGPDAWAIYAADKLTNIEMLRDAYAGQGEQVGEELRVPLDLKVTVWSDDLEMLERNVGDEGPAAALTARFRDQLDGLSRDRAGAGRGQPA